MSRFWYFQTMKHKLISLLLIAFVGCQEPGQARKEEIPEVSVQDLQAVDAEFAAFSRKNGMRRAFMEYIDNDGVMMRDNALPFKGARAIDLISSMNDSTVEMTWEPYGGDLSSSGDLGYTYGVYEMSSRDGFIEKGTYVTIWKKQEDGSWKFVLDSGNQGLGDQQ